VTHGASGLSDDQPIGLGFAPRGPAPAHGVAAIPFATFLSESKVTVSGQPGILTNSSIIAQIIADNDDVLATDWNAPLITNIVAGTGFDIVLRPSLGSYKGSVNVAWHWS
jgi:hypothetical protein